MKRVVAAPSAVDAADDCGCGPTGPWPAAACALRPGALPAAPAGEPPPATGWRYILERFFDRYALDARSLAAFRVGLAVAILGDLLIRARDLRMFYTDAGVFPRTLYWERFDFPGMVSLHLLRGEPLFIGALFAVAAVAALCLLVGYRTRLATVVSWVLLASLQTRTPIVLQGGDVLFRMLAFWAMFLPLEAEWSVDRALSAGEPPPRRVASVATFALAVQVGLVYLFSVLVKTAPEWRHDWSAVHFSLQLDQFLTPFGAVLFSLTPLLPLLTVGTLIIESAIPLLLFSPLGGMAARSVAALLLFFLHLGLGLSLALGPFPWVAGVSALPLVGSGVWDWAGRRLARRRPAIRLHFDGACGFCVRSVALINTFFRLPPAQAAPAQDAPSMHAEMHREHSWVVVDAAGRHHYRFAAFAQLVGASPIFFWLAPFLRLPPVATGGEWLYARISRRRHHVSRWIAKLPVREVTGRLPWFAQAAAALALLYAIIWNISELPGRGHVLDGKRAPGFFFRLDQRWDMFSPAPLKDDGWYVVDARLRDGSRVDLFRGGAPVAWKKPEWAYRLYPNERWRKYFMNLASANTHPDARLNLGRYYCREWNGRPENAGQRQLETFEITFMLETSTPPGAAPPVAEPTVLWRHHCFARSDVPT